MNDVDARLIAAVISFLPLFLAGNRRRVGVRATGGKKYGFISLIPILNSYFTGVAGFLVLLSVGFSALAAPKKNDWKVIEFPGIKPSLFVHTAGGSIDVISDNSSAILYRALQPQESARRYLIWTWRVDKAPPATDLTRRGGDRPLAVHLCFKDNPRSGFAKWLRSLVQPNVGMFFQDHRCLAYVWGGKTVEGEMFPNPYLRNRGVMIVLRGSSTPTGEWFTEKIDCEQDYFTAFGKSAPKPTFLAISGDSDDTLSKAAGSISGLTFTDH